MSVCVCVYIHGDGREPLKERRVKFPRVDNAEKEFKYRNIGAFSSSSFFFFFFKYIHTQHSIETH